MTQLFLLQQASIETVELVLLGRSCVNSIISPMSHCKAVQIFTSTSVVTFSFFPNFAIEAWLIPAAAHRSFSSYLCQLVISKAFYN